MSQRARQFGSGVREKLFSVIPEDRQTVLIECVGRFGDKSNVPLLMEKLRADHRATPYALNALVDIAPEDALAFLETRPLLESPGYGRIWIDRLLDLDHERTSNALRAWLQQGDPTGGTLAAIWSRVEERIDSEAITFLLDRLEEAVAKSPAENQRDPCPALLSLLGSLTLDPVHGALFEARRNTVLSKTVLARAIGHFDGTHDQNYISVRRLLRRIGGDEYEKLVLHALSSDELSKAHTGITTSIFAPTEAVVARLTHLAEHGISEGNDDTARLDLWRTLLALDPTTWRPKLLALLGSSAETDVLLGLFLIPEYAEDGDQAHVLACLEKSEPRGQIEDKAMNVAAAIGEPDPAMTRRAITRLTTGNAEGRGLGCLNVLLNDRSTDGRAALDLYLAPLETVKSWKSHDAEALAIRLGQGDANEQLWRAGERMMHHPFLSGDRFVGSFAERDPPRAMGVLLERAFAPPDILTSAQPDAIDALATLDKKLATQAFVQAWNDHEGRRKYLAQSARHLNDEALQAMIDGLHEEQRHGSGTIAYRAACVELRRAHERARPMLLAHFAAHDATVRLALCEAIGWMPASPALLAEIIAEEAESDVRSRAYEIRRHWMGVEMAVAQFRALRTLETMEYAIDVADPNPLCSWGDPLRIIEDIQPDPRLTGFAERQFARRFNEVQKSSVRRVKIRA